MSLLEVRNLELRFGGVIAVDGLTFSVGDGEIVSVIGPNGAGKTSAFNCITGFYRATGGSARFAGREVTKDRPSRIAASGIARTFQNLRLFPELTVVDNVRAGLHTQLRENVFDALLHTPRYRRAEQFCSDESHRWLDFVGMTGDRGRLVRNLPYGDQRLVEIARALATRPKLLLLDEPGAGLNHGEKARLIDLIRRIKKLAVAVVLIEHDMGLVMKISERVVVLNYGKAIADGPPEQVKRDPAVIEAYLGPDEETSQSVGTDVERGDTHAGGS
ncbi:MAG: ABC transporter ATP-binding protein [Mycobacteriales bacterium]